MRCLDYRPKIKTTAQKCASGWPDYYFVRTRVRASCSRPKHCSLDIGLRVVSKHCFIVMDIHQSQSDVLVFAGPIAVQIYRRRSRLGVRAMAS